MGTTQDEQAMEEQSTSVIPMQQTTPYEMQQFDPQFWSNIPSINWLPLDFPDYVDVSPSFDNSLDPFAWANTYNVQFETDLQLQPPPTGQRIKSPLLTPQDPSPASLGPGPSPSDSNRTRESEIGEYYVDGEPARLPKVKRRRMSSRHICAPAPQLGRNDFSLAITWTRQPPEDDLPWTPVSEETYQAIARTIIYFSQGNEYATQPATPSSLFSEGFGSAIPTKQDLEHLVALFAKHLLPLLPIFHTSRVHSLGWQLTLAAVALGSHYIEDTSAARFSASMHELIRRILYVAEEDQRWLPEDQTQVWQLKLLHCIGLLYCGDPRHDNSGRRLLGELSQAIRITSQRTFSSSPSLNRIETAHSMEWQKFLDAETFIRTWYGIWLLESQQAYQTQQRPATHLSQNMPPLPCRPRYWNALTAESWVATQEHQSSVSQPTFLALLETLYTSKALPSTSSFNNDRNGSFCEYSRLLIIHGIFQRTWSVAAYHSQPLSQWSPSASRTSPTNQMKTTTSSSTQIWLPANTTFAKWRNSACDCLDVLHWAANATIGENKGMEHPTVLHLHIARVVLLTPYDNIVSLAKQLAGEKLTTSFSAAAAAEEMARDKQAIRRWVAQDQYKARLAMIHAGVMFWHVRRFGVGGWYEADAVALATLALWAFSAFSESLGAVRERSRAVSRSQQEQPTQPLGNETNNGSGRAPASANIHPQPRSASASDDESLCEIILLDRPTDDELVQQFVRSGDKMKAHMNGIGDIYGPKSPEKVLLEGRKILNGLSAWGSRDRWVRILERLSTISSGRGATGGAPAGGAK